MSATAAASTRVRRYPLVVVPSAFISAASWRCCRDANTSATSDASTAATGTATLIARSTGSGGGHHGRFASSRLPAQPTAHPTP